MKRHLVILALTLVSHVRAAEVAPGSPPPAPAALTAQSGGDTEVALTWQPSPGATSYTLFRSGTQNDTNTKPVAADLTTTGYTATRLRNDTTYYFRVKAVGPGGTSGFSSEISVTTKITGQPLPNGVYTLAPRNAPQLRLQVNGPKVNASSKAPASPAQQWQLTSLQLATYRIAPAATPDQAITGGGEVAAFTGAPEQQWNVIPISGGFRLTPASAPDRALHQESSVTSLQATNDSSAQTWVILPPPEGGPDGVPDPGTAYVPAGYQLVFSDEFDGPALDTKKWEPLAPYSQPHLNEEMENYLPEAVTLKNGSCVLTADRHDSTCILAGKVPAPHCLGQHTWRSGAITSRATFRHAYYEARLKLPQGVGMWPAFWTTSSTRWPPEWDFLEVQNTVGTLYQYMHPTRGAKMTWVRGAIGRDSVYTTAKGMPNPYDGYVIYGAEVTPKGVKLWINGKLSAEWEVSADTIDPMWVNCELAVGGKWAGTPDDTTPQRNDMFIDYVRVYQSPAVEAEVQALLAAKPPAPEAGKDPK